MNTLSPPAKRRRPRGQGSISHRADGRWEARIDLGRDGNGRRHRRTLYGASRSEVAAKLAEAGTLVRAGRKPADNKTPLADYLTEWLERVRPSLRPSTWVSYEGHVRLHLVPTLGRIPVGKLTARQVGDALRHEVANGSSPRTVGLSHAVLRAALADAVRLDVVPRNVALDARAPKVVRSVPRPWSLDEAGRFLGATAGDRYQALYLLAATAGPRQGELLGLTWANVDLVGHRVTIADSLAWVDGVPYLGPTKSEAGRRTLSLAPMTAAALVEHRRQQDAERETAGSAWRDNGLVFCSPLGQPLRGDVTTHRFQRLLAQHDLPRVRFHDLRRLAATVLLASGATPHEVRATLGHSSIRLTSETYGYLLPEVSRESAASVGRILDDARPRSDRS
jgi:integrase